jgi:hypothetical protein
MPSESGVIGLDVKLAGEADYLFIIHCYVEKAGEVVELSIQLVLSSVGSPRDLPGRCSLHRQDGG